MTRTKITTTGELDALPWNTDFPYAIQYSNSYLHQFINGLSSEIKEAIIRQECFSDKRQEQWVSLFDEKYSLVNEKFLSNSSCMKPSSFSTIENFQANHKKIFNLINNGIKQLNHKKKNSNHQNRVEQLIVAASKLISDKSYTNTVNKVSQIFEPQKPTPIALGTSNTNSNITINQGLTMTKKTKQANPPQAEATVAITLRANASMQPEPKVSSQIELPVTGDARVSSNVSIESSSNTHFKPEPEIIIKPTSSRTQTPPNSVQVISVNPAVSNVRVSETEPTQIDNLHVHPEKSDTKSEPQTKEVTNHFTPEPPLVIRPSSHTKAINNMVEVISGVANSSTTSNASETTLVTTLKPHQRPKDNSHLDANSNTISPVTAQVQVVNAQAGSEHSSTLASSTTSHFKPEPTLILKPSGHVHSHPLSTTFTAETSTSPVVVTNLQATNDATLKNIYLKKSADLLTEVANKKNKYNESLKLLQQFIIDAKISGEVKERTEKVINEVSFANSHPLLSSKILLQTLQLLINPSPENASNYKKLGLEVNKTKLHSKVSQGICFAIAALAAAVIALGVIIGIGALGMVAAPVAGVITATMGASLLAASSFTLFGIKKHQAFENKKQDQLEQGLNSLSQITSP